VTIDADGNRLTFKGTARLAGIAANLDGLMDFRPGPPSQIVRRYIVSGKASTRMLADAGLDAGDMVTGDLGLNVTLNDHRNGDGDMAIDADLTSAALSVAPLGWRKPAGASAKVSARVALSNDQLAGIDAISIDGPGILVRGGVTVSGGKPDGVRLDRAVLGGTDVGGSIRMPPNGPIGIDLTGRTLDLSAKLLEPRAKHRADEKTSAWSARARFERVLLAHDQTANQVSILADNNGVVFRDLLASGKTADGKAFAMKIAQAGTARRLTIQSDDAGTLLRGLNITETIQNGTLSLTGDFNDSAPDHPLSGTLELDDFRVTRAPVLGQLLQALTLYGLVDALGGPGLRFSQLTAPFQLTGDTLVLHDARGFSPSLGLTAKGTIDLTADRLDLEGTVVPAYVFNSLLGNIPLIGRLFSAETGGGLLAMNYALRGTMDNPAVQANPLSALTPGILRGMFGLFPTTPLDRPPPEGKAQLP